MAAYYQRQRLPPPSQSFLDQLETPIPATQPQRLDQSFLIFPEPAHPPISRPPSSNDVPRSPVSSTNSNTSLPSSLVVSVARRSDSRGTRSLSRDASRINEWEELRGPLPPGSGALHLPRTRGRRSSNGSPLIPLSADERLEQKGSGWEWTLDREEESISLDDMLLSWPKVATGSLRSAGDMGTQYEDASSRLLDTRTQWSRPGTPGNEVEAFNLSETLPHQRRLSLRLDGGKSRRISPARQRKYSFKPTLPPSSQQLQNTHTIPRRTPSRPYTLPFGRFLQALFSIDQSTLDLIEEESPSDYAYDHRDECLAKQPDHHLVSDSPQSADRAMLRGFRASHLMPISPFAFPWHLLHLGWDGGVSGLRAIHGTLVDDDFSEA